MNRWYSNDGSRGLARRWAWERLARALRRCVPVSQVCRSLLVHERCGCKTGRSRLTCGSVKSALLSPPVLPHLQQERAGGRPADVVGA